MINPQQQGSVQYLQPYLEADVVLDAQPVEIGVRLKGEADTTWYTAAWIGTAGKTRTAVVLSGPGTEATGVGELPIGTHGVYIRVTDTPEIPELWAYDVWVIA